MTSLRILGLIALVLVPSVVSAGTTGILRGQVTDSGTGQPVANARIRVYSRSDFSQTATNAKGFYFFPSLVPDKYTILIEHDGYNPATDAGIVVAADIVSTERLPLERACNCHPAIRAPFHLRSLQFDRAVTVVSQAHGQYCLPIRDQLRAYGPGIIP